MILNSGFWILIYSIPDYICPIVLQITRGRMRIRKKSEKFPGGRKFKITQETGYSFFCRFDFPAGNKLFDAGQGNGRRKGIEFRRMAEDESRPAKVVSLPDGFPNTSIGKDPQSKSQYNCSNIPHHALPASSGTHQGGQIPNLFHRFFKNRFNVVSFITDLLSGRFFCHNVYSRCA